MQLRFLSGLPRSGSTVLAALLNQHPDLYVTPTSSLVDTMGALVHAWESAPANVERDDDEIYRMLDGVWRARYRTVKKRMVADKSRGWPAPAIMRTMARVLGEAPRIVATVRSVPECAANFVKVAKPADVNEFLRSSQPIQHLKDSYVTLQTGLKEVPGNFLIVDYDTLLDNPTQELARICEFWDLPQFDFDVNAIDGTPVKERDAEAWNIPGLHDIRPRLQRSKDKPPAEVLGGMYAEFDQPRFWLGEGDRPKQLLDIQKEHAERGEFKEARDLCDSLLTLQPDNHRAAYNKGLFVLMDGKLQEGMELLDRGRIVSCFGNAPPSNQPLWDGTRGVTVLLNCEGGLGDQIHGVRYARDIAARGCKVVVAASAPLCPLFNDVPGVSAVVQSNAAGGVYHDMWVPSMSAVRPLGFEYKHLSDKPYIGRLNITTTRFRIGLRWQGNPRFEADHHKLFPPEPFFEAVGGHPVEYVSLQRDEGSQHRPEWVRESKLETWQDTAAEVAQCDLVISSCTSVAHLAGAMGKPTWIIVPVLPYYLWAPPGERTPHYDAVVLFRQAEFGSWEKPFSDVKMRLQKLMESISEENNPSHGTAR